MRWHQLILLALVGITLSAPSCAAPAKEPSGSEDERWTIALAEPGFGRGWLGVAVEDMTERMARRMGSEATSGALINEVIEKSPAERAGLKVDDIIVDVEGRTIRDADDLIRAVRKIDPDTTVTLTVVRGRQRVNLRVEIGSRAGSGRHLGWVWPGRDHAGDMLGMQLRNLRGQLATFFKVPGGRGVLIEEVSEDGPAKTAGLQSGDVIVRCGDEPVRDIDDLRWVLEDATAKQHLSMEVIRSGAKRTFKLEVPEEIFESPQSFFRNQMFHFSPELPDAERLRKEIERELPHEVRKLKREHLHIEGLDRSMETLRRELESLGRQLERETHQAKESLQRALQSTIL